MIAALWSCLESGDRHAASHASVSSRSRQGAREPGGPLLARHVQSRNLIFTGPPTVRLDWPSSLRRIAPAGASVSVVVLAYGESRRRSDADSLRGPAAPLRWRGERGG